MCKTIFRAQTAKYRFTDKHKRAPLIQNTDAPDSIIACSQCSKEFCNTIPVSDQTADIAGGPIGDKTCREQVQQIAPLFDHLVGAGLDRPVIATTMNSERISVRVQSL
jgi:hypothetical protein